jgi:exosortase family protein XrtF
MNLIKEFKPTILFLLKFLVLYLVGNMGYGLYITHYSPEVDPATRLVSQQAAFILSIGHPGVSVLDYHQHASTLLVENGKTILSIYEGCNGINTTIIFVSFLFAFGPIKKTLWWFIPLGVCIIWIVNQGRILFLFYVAKEMPDLMYFTHKYLFTGVLFGVILALWIWWIAKFSKPKSDDK